MSIAENNVLEKLKFSTVFTFSTHNNILYMLRKDAEKTVNLQMIFQIIDFH